jgi:hypothetical protein
MSIRAKKSAVASKGKKLKSYLAPIAFNSNNNRAIKRLPDYTI